MLVITIDEKGSPIWHAGFWRQTTFWQNSKTGSFLQCSFSPLKPRFWQNPPRQTGPHIKADKRDLIVAQHTADKGENRV
jgi:hypothetical protein